MNLRVNLLLIIAVSWIGILAAFIFDSDFGSVKSPEQPPFFYTLDSQDIKHISIETAGLIEEFSFRDDVGRWFIDGMEGIPASLYRWGGMTTLLGGPRTQRVLKQSIDDPATYGLKDPSARYTVTLSNGSKRVLLIGDTTINGASNYAKMQGYPQLVLVDVSWSEVLNRLATEPPIPDWLYELDPKNAKEILFFLNNDVVEGYGVDNDTGTWRVCDFPIDGDPCKGTESADENAITGLLEHIKNHKMQGVQEISFTDEKIHELYGTDQDAPYFVIRTESIAEGGYTLVSRTSMIIGKPTKDGKSRYAVAMETKDIIKVDINWANKILELFDQAPLRQN